MNDSYGNDLLYIIPNLQINSNFFSPIPKIYFQSIMRIRPIHLYDKLPPTIHKLVFHYGIRKQRLETLSLQLKQRIANQIHQLHKPWCQRKLSIFRICHKSFLKLPNNDYNKAQLLIIYLIIYLFAWERWELQGSFLCI